MAIVPIEILKTKFESGDFPRSSDYQDLIDTLSSASGAITSTNDLSEGSTNKYFTDERAQDALGNSLGTGLSYNDTTGAISVTSNTYDSYGSASAVAENLGIHESDTTTHGTTGNIVGTSDTQTLTNKTLTSPKINEDVILTTTSTELNYVDGVTSAIQTQINGKAPSADPTFTGTVSGVTKTHVGLGNVDNTSDANKPVSTATETALNLKANLSGPTFTGTVVLPSTTSVGDVSSTELSYLNNVTSGIQTQIDAKAPIASPTFTGTVAGITKSMIDLANVDNTTDLNKPISTATQTALDAKASLAGATFTGSVEIDQNLVVDGNLTVNGTSFNASATSITIEDNILQLAHENAANTVDLGLVVGYNDGTAKHAGLVKDTSDGAWKLFKGVTTEPSTTVDFTQGSLDDLKVAGLTASSLTLGNVSNTEFGYLDGVTSAIQTQIDSKAPLASPTFTGTVSGVTKTHVGLGSVDNTSDTAKPISTATQTALDLKAPLVSPTFTGTPTLPTGTIATTQTAGNSTTAVATTAFVTTADNLKANIAGPTFTGTVTIPTLDVTTKLIAEQSFTVALSDETTSITTGTSKVTFRAPFAMTLTKIPRASLANAGTGTSTVVDINKSGTSILSTKLTIDATQKTSTTSGTTAVLSSSTINDDEEITIDIDAAGTAARGLKVTIFYKRS